MEQTFKRILTFVVLLIAFVSASYGQSNTTEAPLFTPIAFTSLSQRDQPCRSSIPLVPDTDPIPVPQYVTLNPERVAALDTSSQLVVKLFDGMSYTVVQKEILPRPSGEAGYIWTGVLANVLDSSVILVVGDDQFYGRIGIAGRYAVIHRIEGDVYAIEQHELDADPVQLVDVDTPHEVSNTLPLALETVPQRVDDGSQIDIMVVYTPVAQSILERVAGSVSLAVDGAIAHTNTIFENSSINTRLKLVHVQPVFYLEQPNEDISADLENLMGEMDGYMDEVHALRDQYRADLVAMISGVWFASYAGIAPNPSPLNAAKGFSITEACNIQDTTFTEQIGLNLGSARDFANANAMGEQPVLPYGYGYQAPDASFVTVMARRSGGECPQIVTANVCHKVERFSSPNQTKHGRPLGTELADNVRSINELAIKVASYRSETTGIGTEFVINGGFTVDGDGDKTPDFWKVGGTGKAKVDCENPGYYDPCALKLKGAGSRVTQVLDSELLGVDTEVLLTVWAKTNKLNNEADARLILRYTDDTKSVIMLIIPPGKPEVFQWFAISGAAEQTVSKAKFVVRLSGAETGKLWLDNVSVLIFSSARSGR
jgi:peptidyl-Asp metalloendopeptidase